MILMLLTIVLSYSSFFIYQLYENKIDDQNLKTQLEMILYYFFICGLYKDGKQTENNQSEK